MAIVDIAAMEPAPTARRFEVYGTGGSAIMEPMEPADTLRLALTEPRGGYPAGVSIVDLEARPRYVASLEAFVKDIRGEKQPDRSLDHELLVQETILRPPVTSRAASALRQTIHPNPPPPSLVRKCPSHRRSRAGGNPSPTRCITMVPEPPCHAARSR